MIDKQSKIISEELQKSITKLMKDTVEAKELFILEELLPHVDTSDKNNLNWSQPMRLRIKELKEYKQTVKEALEKLSNCGCDEGCMCGFSDSVNETIKELGLDE